MSTNEIYIGRDFGWFSGNIKDNQTHRHYAIQLSIPLEDEIILEVQKKSIKTNNAILIQPNIPHKIISTSAQFLLLINPASTIGHFWRSMSEEEFSELNNEPVLQLKRILKFPTKSESHKAIKNIIDNYDCFCDSLVHDVDQRINLALSFLQKNFDRVIPLEEIANHCHLSPSRFRHLFKEKTGITYRRAQLWNKLTKGMSLIEKKSFTELAHTVGFSDSAHFSRIFKENFGFNPRSLIKNSHFIQV